MGFTPLVIDRENLTIMGVRFPDLETLNGTIGPLCSIMFEGFKPTPNNIEILRDYFTGDITLREVVSIFGDKTNAV